MNNFSRFGQLLDMSHNATLMTYNRGGSEGYRSGGTLEMSKTYVAAIMVASDNLGIPLSLENSEANQKILEYSGVTPNQFKASLDYIVNKGIGKDDGKGIILSPYDVKVARDILADDPIIRQPTYSLAHKDGKLCLFEDSPFYGEGARTGLGTDKKREGVSTLDVKVSQTLGIPSENVDGNRQIETIDFISRGITLDTMKAILNKYPDVLTCLNNGSRLSDERVTDVKLSAPSMIAEQDIKLTNLTDLTIQDGFTHDKHETATIKGAPDAALEAFHRLSTVKGNGNTPSVKDYVARAIVVSDDKKKSISLGPSKGNDEIASASGMSSGTLLDAAKLMVSNKIAKLKGRFLEVSDSVIHAAREYDKGNNLGPVHFDLYTMKEVKTIGDRINGVSLSMARFMVVEVSPFVVGGCKMIAKPVASLLGLGRKAMETMEGLMPSLRQQISKGLEPVASGLTVDELKTLDTKISLKTLLEHSNSENPVIISEAYRFGTLRDVEGSHNTGVTNEMDKVKEAVGYIRQGPQVKNNSMNVACP